MVMTRPPAYHPGNFLMKNMNPTNSGLNNTATYGSTSLHSPCYSSCKYRPPTNTHRPHRLFTSGSRI